MSCSLLVLSTTRNFHPGYRLVGRGLQSGIRVCGLPIRGGPIYSHYAISIAYYAEGLTISKRGIGEDEEREAYSPVCLPWLLGFLILLAASTTSGSDQRARGGNPPYVPDGGWSFFMRGGAAHQFETELDDGGDFRVNRLFLQGGARYAPDYQRSVSLALGVGFDGYDFSGDRGIAALSPWETVHTVRISAPLRWGIGREWTVFVIPTVRSSAESGASLGDSVSGGGFTGFSYRFGDRLTIGPGIGVMTEIEDSPDIFPLLLIDWKITDRLRLETGRGLGATQGPGLFLRWKASEKWDVSFGGRYEKLRFRLDREGVAPDGVGSDRSFPLFCGATYRFTPRSEASLVGGMALGGELRLEDENGNRITEEEYGKAGFLGVAFGLRF